MPAKPKRSAGGKPREVVLWEMPMSHHCVKARKLLDLKGVAHTTKYVPYHDKRELLKASGQDYVPWLQWGGQGVVWHQLVDFLEAEVPTPSAFPGGRAGEHRVWEMWAHDLLEELVWRYVVPEMPATFQDDHERWVFEELQERKRGPLSVMKERQGKFLEDLKPALGHLEATLGDGRDFLLGDEAGLADCATYGALSPIPYAGKDLPREFPKLRAWQQRVGKL